MSADYKLVVRTKVGAKVGETSDFLELAYQKRVNEPGLLKFRLRGDHTLAGNLQEDSQVEVWRRNAAASLGWYVDFRGFCADVVFETKYTTFVTATVPGELSLLSRRIIAYAANTNAISSFITTPAETVLKELVRTNATAAATVVNLRDKSGIFTSYTLTVATDLGRGTSVSWAGSRKNLITELQRIATVAGGDFALNKTGPASWSFEFYPGQLGTDKSASVVFALERGNMAAPRLRTVPKSVGVVIVAGQGQDASRDVVIVGSGDGAELFVDGRNDQTTGALTARGAVALEEGLASSVLTFDVVQAPSCLYGKHYAVGDLVTAEYRTISAVKKVVGVAVAMKGGAESVEVEVD